MRKPFELAAVFLWIATLVAASIALAHCGTCKGPPAEIAPTEPDVEEPAAEPDAAADETPAAEPAE
jgi:hypothetical protein